MCTDSETILSHKADAAGVDDAHVNKSLMGNVAVTVTVKLRPCTERHNST